MLELGGTLIHLQTDQQVNTSKQKQLYYHLPFIAAGDNTSLFKPNLFCKFSLTETLPSKKNIFRV